MTGEEFLALTNQTIKTETIGVPSDDKEYVYGISGIARIFGCSKATANRIRWPPSFPCATELLCTMTSSHKSTIIRARAALKAAGLRQCSPKQSYATTAATTVATTHATSSATLYKEIDKNKYNFKEYGKCKSKQTDRRRGSEVPDASPEEYSAPF